MTAASTSPADTLVQFSLALCIVIAMCQELCWMLRWGERIQMKSGYDSTLILYTNTPSQRDTGELWHISTVVMGAQMSDSWPKLEIQGRVPRKRSILNEELEGAEKIARRWKDRKNEVEKQASMMAYMRSCRVFGTSRASSTRQGRWGHQKSHSLPWIWRSRHWRALEMFQGDGREIKFALITFVSI